MDRVIEKAQVIDYALRRAKEISKGGKMIIVVDKDTGKTRATAYGGSINWLERCCYTPYCTKCGGSGTMLGDSCEC